MKITKTIPPFAPRTIRASETRQGVLYRRAEVKEVCAVYARSYTFDNPMKGTFGFIGIPLPKEESAKSATLFGINMEPTELLTPVDPGFLFVIEQEQQL